MTRPLVTNGTAASLDRALTLFHPHAPFLNEPKQFRQFRLVHHSPNLIAAFAATTQVREDVVAAAADRQDVVEAEVLDIQGDAAIDARLVEGVGGDEIA
jgi:hypothetical protein